MPSDRKFWNKIARKYANDPIANVAAYEYTLERTASYLSPHQRVLEIGCGTGTTALRLAPHVAQYTGTDVSDEMIVIAREKNAAEAVAHLSFEQFDVDTDHTTQTYDVILGFNVLHLLRGSGYGISTLDQMLQPGGLLITKTICYPDGWRGIALRSIIAVMPLLRMIGKAPFCAFRPYPTYMPPLTRWDTKCWSRGIIPHPRRAGSLWRANPINAAPINVVRFRSKHRSGYRPPVAVFPQRPRRPRRPLSTHVDGRRHA